MNIGELARRSGLTAKMIRYYEKIDLISVPIRSASGYRVYTEQDLSTLSFIKHAKDLGFSIDQIKSLVELWKNPDRKSADVKKITDQHIHFLTEQIHSMQSMILKLKAASQMCSNDSTSNCSILNQIEHIQS
ncbi:Cu(I)-responsive transcriptional regulator [Acinetobacter sp. DSM 11652]|uniref:Cu(I)-responsive transcriptional regulator n=1 Tax=Acinetobacter sp. DSM 11652 TaxID=346222 RepID=UPI0008CD4CC4|nr:Cu(I)-responsive transcriptional regulator [Acinetobacter sp. DSM 11652]SEL39803.1 MerR family transcriptional regulator, copper efflux regulator [Acinetobacter sp. DSM 11652]